MSGGTASAATGDREFPEVARVDHRAPRFGQLITMTLLGLGVILQEPLLVLAVAVILCAAVVSGWRLDLYGLLWRHLMVRVFGAPAEKEAAAPHRFAKLMGAVFTALATVLLFAAPVLDLVILAVAGYVIAGIVAIMAAIGGVGDYCIGCKMYAEVAYFRRLGIL